MKDEMKIYLDTCCYCRPFDDQSQTRIKKETDAIFELFNFADTGKIQIITSNAVKMEISRIQSSKLRNAVLLLHNKFVSEKIKFSNDMKTRFFELITYKFRKMDAMHIVFAETKQVILVSTDDKMIHKARIIKDKIVTKVIYPQDAVKMIGGNNE